MTAVAQTKNEKLQGDLEDSFSETLIASGLIDDSALARARRAAARRGARLDRVLVELGLIEEERLGRFVAD